MSNICALSDQHDQRVLMRHIQFPIVSVLFFLFCFQAKNILSNGFNLIQPVTKKQTNKQTTIQSENRIFDNFFRINLMLFLHIS